MGRNTQDLLVAVIMLSGSLPVENSCDINKEKTDPLNLTGCKLISCAITKKAGINPAFLNLQ